MTPAEMDAIEVDLRDAVSRSSVGELVTIAQTDVPALVAALREAWRERDAAFRAGAEAMREDAARVCRDVARTFIDGDTACSRLERYGALECVEAVRALPIPQRRPDTAPGGFVCHAAGCAVPAGGKRCTCPTARAIPIPVRGER